LPNLSSMPETVMPVQLTVMSVLPPLLVLLLNVKLLTSLTLPPLVKLVVPTVQFVLLMIHVPPV
jgi:hypothetical protein